MLKLVAKFADRGIAAGYESFSTSSTCSAALQRRRRDVNTIDISEQLLVCIGTSDAEVEAKWKAAQMLKPFVTPESKARRAVDRGAQEAGRDGITTFTIFFSDFAPPPTLELFAKE